MFVLNYYTAKFICADYMECLYFTLVVYNLTNNIVFVGFYKIQLYSFWLGHFQVMIL